MSLGDSLEQFVVDRIGSIMNQGFKATLQNSPEKEYDIEAVLASFSPDVRQEVDQLMEHLFSCEAEKERLLYLSGLKDGFHIAKRLLL